MRLKLALSALALAAALGPAPTPGAEPRRVFATFSIVAFDPRTGDLGVAVASKFPAVGSGVPWARAGVGAVATQAAANLSFGEEGLRLMGKGMSASRAMEKVLAADPLREERQVGMVDAKRGAASFTGKNCFPWAGGRTGGHYAVQGNILAGAGVVDAMAEAFESASGELHERLMRALEAGDAAGGDRRGKESAAILVVRKGAGYGGKSDRWVDLRVDDHPDPVAELRRLLAVHQLYFGKTDRSRVHVIDAELARELQTVLKRRGFYQGKIHGVYDPATRKALEDYMGWENLEERIQKDDTIDDVVLRYIREREESPAP
jgi:uncharacterized Ntn-hydrolase superfamily protein